MLYKGGFSDINGKTYEVNIQTGTVTTEVPITLSDDPVNINVPSESLFFPIKSRECNIEIVSDEYIMDMYQTSSRNAKVWVRDCDADKVIFFGYLTPNEYSQSYSHLDTIQLNAVDALSTLKDFRFEFSGATPKYVTMLSLVVSFMKDAGYTGTLFIPNTYDYINGFYAVNKVPDDGNVLQCLYVSEANFVDDDEEKTHWTKYEVLQEIMQFMGWSICPYGHDVYIVDYKAEAATDAVPYFEYDLTNDTTDTEDLPNVPIVITKDTNAAPGTPVFSLDEVYNKISISDNLYEVDEIAPKIDDDIMEDVMIPYYNSVYPLELGESQWTMTTRKKHWWKKDEISTETTGYDYQTFKLFKDTSGFKHNFFKRRDLTPVHNENYSDCYDSTSPSEYNTNIINKYLNTLGCVVQHYAYRKNEGANNLPTSLDWDTYLTFFITDDTILPYEDNWGRLIIAPESDPQSIFKYQKNAVLEYEVPEEINWKPSTGTSWITINADLFYQYNNEEFDSDKIYTVNNNIITSSPIDKSTQCSIKSYCHLDRKYGSTNYGNGFPTWRMKLQIGEGQNAKWWNGNQKKWVNYDTTFDIPYNNNPSNHDDEFMPAFSWASIKPNTDYTDKVGKNCYAIPIDSGKSTDPSFGKMHLWIYAPYIIPLEVISLYTEVYSFDRHKKWYTLPTTIYAKNFELGYVYTTDTIWYEQSSDNDKEDVIYTNVINEAYTNEFSNLEFKINTQIADKPISRSYVCIENGYLNTLNHIYGDGIKTQEKNIIDLYYYHHNEPKKIYTCNLHGCPKPNDVFVPNVIDGRFVLNYYNWDIHNDNIEINMIQY